MIAIRRLLDWAQDNRWIWSAIAVLISWGLLSAITDRFSVASLSGILLSASFLSVVGVGQMFVVAAGRGNIDLSIASVVTLSAYLALLTVNGQDANLAWGLLAALALGLGVGAFNAALVVGLRVPAIIATLATGYVLATATLLSNRAIHGFAVSPALREIAAGRLFGAPKMLLICLALIAATEGVLRFTAFGKKLSAVGQNRSAARLAGIRVARVVAATFVISSVLASLMGFVLGAYVGGAFLDMGQAYLLQSVAAVVLGGTLILGGYATAVGVFFASVLLILIVTLMQIMQLPPGSQDIVQGVVVIVVLALAGREALTRRAPAQAELASKGQGASS